MVRSNHLNSVFCFNLVTYHPFYVLHFQQVGVAYSNKIQELKSQNLEEEELEKKLELLKVSNIHLFKIWITFLLFVHDQQLPFAGIVHHPVLRRRKKNLWLELGQSREYRQIHLAVRGWYNTDKNPRGRSSTTGTSASHTLSSCSYKNKD